MWYLSLHKIWPRLFRQIGRWSAGPALIVALMLGMIEPISVVLHCSAQSSSAAAKPLSSETIQHAGVAPRASASLKPTADASAPPCVAKVDRRVPAGVPSSAQPFHEMAIVALLMLIIIPLLQLFPPTPSVAPLIIPRSSPLRPPIAR
jgi:hypothetical protein